MIELTEQEKCVILNIAKRTSIDVDGDFLDIFVNQITGNVSVVERFVTLSKDEHTYIHHDRKITADIYKEKSWFDYIKGEMKKIGRGNGRHDTFFF